MIEADEANFAMVQRAVRGDAMALKLLLTKSRTRLRDQMAGRVPRDLRSVLDVDDIVQETHVEIFRRIDGFKPQNNGSFDRWVTTIALSRLRNAIKRYRAAKRGGRHRATSLVSRNMEDSALALLDNLADPGRTPSRCVARTEAVEAVQNALAELPDHYRRAVWLVHIEGQPVKNVAIDMGKSERAIHGLCRRGLHLLRDRLGSATRFLTSSG
jgi:RNA polymerase sigma-70 factor (ECF subfamily)